MAEYGESVRRAVKGPSPVSPYERFCRNVQVQTNGCWIWTGGRDGHGYGRISVGSTADGTLRRMGAHRLAWEMFIGPLDELLTLDHFLCKNILCVNPDHLEEVTVVENVMRGDSCPAANARKTHCKRGHPLSGYNLSVTPQGYRQCKTCMRERAYAKRNGLEFH
jgi:hypothetical protein